MVCHLECGQYEQQMSTRNQDRSESPSQTHQQIILALRNQYAETAVRRNDESEALFGIFGSPND